MQTVYVFGEILNGIFGEIIPDVQVLFLHHINTPSIALFPPGGEGAGLSPRLFDVYVVATLCFAFAHAGSPSHTQLPATSAFNRRDSTVCCTSCRPIVASRASPSSPSPAASTPFARALVIRAARFAAAKILRVSFPRRRRRTREEKERETPHAISFLADTTYNIPNARELISGRSPR